MKATHTTHNAKDNCALANMVLRAISRLIDYPCGTIANPTEYASLIMRDGRTLIQTVAEDGFLRFNDGYVIIEADDYVIYVDYTTRAINDWKLGDYKYYGNLK